MRLNVISFNIRCCDDADGNSILERAPRLKKILDSYDADVIGLQEYTPKWDEYFRENFSDEYEIFNKYRSEKNFEGVPMLWKKDKFECLKKGYFWLSDTPEVESSGWDEVYNLCRICLYAVLKDKEMGEIFTFMNVHYGFGDNGQVKSSKLLYDYSKKISDYPTFITGDFNMTSDRPGYQEITKYFTDVNMATAKETSHTFHEYGKQAKSRIDYCFANSKVTPVNQKNITETVDGKYPSDHYGLYIELDI